MESMLPVPPIPDKAAGKMSVYLFSCKSLVALCILRDISKGVTDDLENKVDKM